MAILYLEDGTSFTGISFGAPVMRCGELIFNTAMTGYQEICTDSSYAGQVVLFSYPHIGNTGVTHDDNENPRPYCQGVIVRDYCEAPSNWRSKGSLADYLRGHSIPALSGVDTRYLVQTLRDKGALRCVIDCSQELSRANAIQALSSFPGLNGADYASQVSTKESYTLKPKTPNGKSIAVLDLGVKKSILNGLLQMGFEITCYPAKSSIDTILSSQPKAVLVSNGPGDPAACLYQFPLVLHCIKNKIPLFGICLGFQIIALALGAKTKKMKFGHHGANHPIIDLRTKGVFITSQNHSFEVEESTLPGDLEVTHRSLFDQSLQGITSKSHPILAVQGHPEANPGPREFSAIFKEFNEIINTHA